MKENKSVDMQDHRTGDVVCARCGRVILTQEKANGMRERTITEFVEAHVCTVAAESKKDFEDEIR